MIGNKILSTIFTPSNFNYTWNYTMGYSFTVSQDCYVTELGGCFNGTKSVFLKNKTTGVVIASASVTASNTFSYTELSTPILLTIGNTYQVFVQLVGSGGAYGRITSPVTIGNVTITASGYTAGTATNIDSYTIKSAMYGVADISIVDSISSINMKTKVGDSWKEVQSIYHKVGGVWKPVTKVFTKVSGIWKE